MSSTSTSAPRRRLRTASSSSSLRLASFGGILHFPESASAAEMAEQATGTAASTSTVLPSFQDTTLRWSGTGTATATANKQTPPPSSFWPDWNWTGHESSIEDMEECEYDGSEASDPVTPTSFPAPPRAPAAVAVKVSPPRAQQQAAAAAVSSVHATPTRARQHPPIQRIRGQSHTRTVSQDQEQREGDTANKRMSSCASADDGDVDDGQAGYSSLEQVSHT